MRSIVKIILPALILLIASCAKAPVYTAEIRPLEDNTDGEFYLRSNGRGVSENEGIIESENNAFNAVLFRGVNGIKDDKGVDVNGTNNASRPLVDNESESKSQHKDFYKKFFDKRDYQQFIISSTVTDRKKQGGFNIITSDIKINMKGLRDYLVQNGITRKFGW